jgi:Major Facilitator Superfamily
MNDTRGIPARRVHRVPSPARWWVLALLSVIVAGNYYAYDSIAPVADLLRTGRGFTQSQIGLLNAVFSLPNIILALAGGMLIDRYGPARVSLWTAALCFIGAILTAVGFPFGLMVTGRLLFGVGEETLLIALLAGLARRFSAGGTANVLHTFALTRRLAATGITANCLHPGVVATNLLPRWLRIVKPFMSRGVFDAERGARTTLHLALSNDVAGVSGRYFDENQTAQPAAETANDATLQDALWQASERWVSE